MVSTTGGFCDKTRLNVTFVPPTKRHYVDGAFCGKTLHKTEKIPVGYKVHLHSTQVAVPEAPKTIPMRR